MAMILNLTAEETTVKRLLRRQSTRQYFKEDGWTENPREAKCFSDALEAAETCARYGLKDVELALVMGSQESEFFCTSVR